MPAGRYQPVYHDVDGKRVYSLCELRFDDAGQMVSHSDPLIGAGGDDREDLTVDLARMLVDAFRWEPVAFTEIHQGMTFRERMSQGQMDRLADYIQEVASSFKRQPVMRHN